MVDRWLYVIPYGTTVSYLAIRSNSGYYPLEDEGYMRLSAGMGDYSGNQKQP